MGQNVLSTVMDCADRKRAHVNFREASFQSHKVPIGIPFAIFFVDGVDTMDLLDDKESQDTLVVIQGKFFMLTFHFYQET